MAGHDDRMLSEVDNEEDDGLPTGHLRRVVQGGHGVEAYLRLPLVNQVLVDVQPRHCRC